MKPIIRGTLVTVTIPAGTVAGAFIKFPTQQGLPDGVLVNGIEMFDATQLTQTPDQVPVIVAADRIDATLTLNDGSDIFVRDMPLTALNTTVNGGIWKEFDPRKVDLQKSGVRMTTTFATLPVAVAFMWYYQYPDDPSQ